MGEPPSISTTVVNIDITTDEAGDWTILTGPALRKGLEESFKNAPKCNNKRLKRRGTLCGFAAFFDSAIHLEALPEVEHTLAKRLLVKSPDLATALNGLKHVGVYTIAAAAALRGVGIAKSAYSYLLMCWRLQSADDHMGLPPIIRVPKHAQDTAKEEDEEEEGCILKEGEQKVSSFSSMSQLMGVVANVVLLEQANCFQRTLPHNP